MAGAAICSIDGCNNPVRVKSRGWCSMHYQRWHKNGDPSISKIDRQTKVCAEPGCGNAKFAKGLCVKHYGDRRRDTHYQGSGVVRYARHGQINDLPVPIAAYLAGLIDADGTVTVQAPSTGNLPKPMVLIVNSDFALIEWLLATIGAGCAYQTKANVSRPTQRPANWREVHRFQMTGWKALSLLERVRPFMRVKAAQADLVMSMAMRGRDFKRSATDEQRAAALDVLDRVRKLNVRGRQAA